MIDDDTELLFLNKKYFVQKGYNVLCFSDPLEGIDYLKNNSADIILLDVMMPNIDGFEAMCRIRQFSKVPIIFLTGKDDEENKIKGLLNGADDYMCKPFSLAELSARIQVQLRKESLLIKKNVKQKSSIQTLSFPPLLLNRLDRKLFYLDQEVPLSNREFSFLQYMMENARRLVTFEEIGNKTWGFYEEKDRRSVMVLASRVRNRLSCFSDLENAIETEYGKGYRFTLKS